MATNLYDIQNEFHGREAGLNYDGDIVLNKRNRQRAIVAGTVLATTAQIASPTAAMLANILTTYQDSVTKARYQSNGAALVSVGGGGGISFTDITAAALAALNAGTASASVIYRVTDGTYRGQMYTYDVTNDVFYPLGSYPGAFV